MQGHTAAASINGSPVPSPHSIDYSQPTIATGRISTYELPTENSIPEEQGEEMSSIAIPYYTTVEPLSVGSSSHDSISSASPSSDSVASGHAVHVTVLQSSGLSDTGSDPANLCVPSSQSDSGSSSTVKHWTYEEQFKQVRKMCVCFVLFWINLTSGLHYQLVFDLLLNWKKSFSNNHTQFEFATASFCCLQWGIAGAEWLVIGSAGMRCS